MPKTQFKFNPHTLEYEQVQPGFKQRFKTISTVLVISVLLSGAGIGLFIKYVDSPKEAYLRDEIHRLQIQFDIANHQIGEMETKLGDISMRDENVYRTILEADPIKEEVRQAGIGGSNPYASLEGTENADLIISTRQRLDQLNAKIDIQGKSLNFLEQAAAQRQKQLACIPAIQPISNKNLKRIASGFGWRKHPVYRVKKKHTGIDFSAEIGAEIYATGDGKVIKVVNSRRGYGKHLVIDHGFGYQTLYGHLSKFNVKRGQTVKRGEIIGYVGNSGTSTAPHLHYEVIRNKRKINPINFFYNDLTPEQYEEMRVISSQPNQSLD